MPAYIIGTVLTDGQYLTPEIWNDEFARIAAVLASLDLDNFADTSILQYPLVINAGDPRFQTGGLDRAELVAAAIAEAVAGNVKVVYVPRALFGYGEDPGFSAGAIFNTTVLMIREGQMAAGADPVAYGAKVDDAAADDQASFQAAADAAAAAGAAGNPGAAHVLVSVPGAYQLGSDVVLASGVGYTEAPGVSLAGAGKITTAVAGITKSGGIGVRGIANRLEVRTSVTVNLGASATNNGSFNVAGIPTADWILGWVEFKLDEDTGTSVQVAYGHAAAPDTTNLSGVIDKVYDAGGEYNIDYTITNNDGVSAHDVDTEWTLWFFKREAW